jgi:quinol monooxygenase YgiN
MPVRIIIDLQVQPGKGDELVALFKEVVPGTRGFDGCIECSVWRNREDTDQLSIVEAFESREVYDRYFAWRSSTGVLERLGALLAPTPPMRMRFFDDIGA